MRVSLNDMDTQYKTPGKLEVRRALHAKYSVNPQGFDNWLHSFYGIAPGFRVLELGCGTGESWLADAPALPRDAAITLTDLSPGMVERARETLGAYPQFAFQTADIQSIPFEDAAFDLVLAHMMLYHVPELPRALMEVRRVLKPEGRFHCATYGEHTVLKVLRPLLPELKAGERFNRRFTLQNGAATLGAVFSKVERCDYEDALEITEVEDLVDYLYSLPNQADLSPALRPEIARRLRERQENGVLRIPKEYGVFICQR